MHPVHIFTRSYFVVPKQPQSIPGSCLCLRASVAAIAYTQWESHQSAHGLWKGACPCFPHSPLTNIKGIPLHVYTRWNSPSATKSQVVLLIVVMLILYRRWRRWEKRKGGDITITSHNMKLSTSCSLGPIPAASMSAAGVGLSLQSWKSQPRSSVEEQGHTS